ncbi:hypothetical protein D3Z36_14650 [Lachnospiraceae bacterium]|nr:hypothetical protein [Lachnospiraceae bacterium]
MKKKVERFVKWELEMFRTECNFSPDEAMFFDLRNDGDGMSLEEIAGQMGYSMSKITDLVSSVNEKIIKVLPLGEAYFKKYCKEYR